MTRLKPKFKCLSYVVRMAPSPCILPPFVSQALVYEQTDHEKKRTIESGDVKGEFWNTLFTKRSPDGVRTDLETYWAWSLSGETVASDNPRLEFASSPHLYKIYVTQLRNNTGAATTKKSTEPPCEEFLKVFLPVFRAALSESPPDQSEPI